MRSEWNFTPVGDLISYLSKGIPPSYVDTVSNTTICVLNQKCNRDNKITFENSRLHDTAKKIVSEEKLLKDNDILINSTGTGTAGRIAQINQVSFPITVDGHMIIVRANEKINPIYLGYYLKMQQFLIEQLAEGSTGQTELNRKRFCTEIIIGYPSDYNEQKAIAAVLSALDDKIELNNRINQKLEEMAQAIFKSWFVDFEPFQDGEFLESELGLIPKGWSVKSLSECCSTITRGITPKYDENTNQIVINQKCIRNHEVNLAPARRHKPKAITDKWLKYGDVLVNSTGQGTLGRTAQWFGTQQNITVDSHITIVRPVDSSLVCFLGQLIMSREIEIENMASGSTGQTELSRERVGSMCILLPDTDSLQKFSAIVQPLMNAAIYRNEEVTRLSNIRDSLLPKLMSGEITFRLEV